MMKASFSSLERYTKTLEIDEESLDSINTEIFGLIEKRFLIGLVTHKVLELIFKEYNGHEINTLSIKNQDMYEYVTEILGKCISESESKYFEELGSLFIRLIVFFENLALKRKLGTFLFSISMRIRGQISLSTLQAKSGFQ